MMWGRMVWQLFEQDPNLTEIRIHARENHVDVFIICRPPEAD